MELSRHSTMSRTRKCWSQGGSLRAVRSLATLTPSWLPCAKATPLCCSFSSAGSPSSSIWAPPMSPLWSVERAPLLTLLLPEG